MFRKTLIFLLISILCTGIFFCQAKSDNIITNKDIENLKRQTNNGNIPKAKKKNTPIKITKKQEIKPSKQEDKIEEYINNYSVIIDEVDDNTKNDEKKGI